MEFPVTASLVIMNVIISLIGLRSADFFSDNAFWIAPIRQGGQWHRLVTSAFLHANLPHLFINMFVLWEFGRAIEYSLGGLIFALIYFASLLAGNLWEYFSNRDNPDYRAVGASGATSGIVISYSVLAPFSMLGLFFIIPVPAILAAIGFIVISFILSRKEQTMIAHGAHLGGALAGGIMTFVLVPGALSALIEQILSVLG